MSGNTAPKDGTVAPPDGQVDRQLLRIAFILVLGTFMATLDATIVSVGIDSLSEEFDASVAGIQWVTTAYLLAVVAAVPASGWLADRFGGRMDLARRRGGVPARLGAVRDGLVGDQPGRVPGDPGPRRRAAAA